MKTLLWVVAVTGLACSGGQGGAPGAQPGGPADSGSSLDVAGPPPDAPGGAAEAGPAPDGGKPDGGPAGGADVASVDGPAAAADLAPADLAPPAEAGTPAALAVDMSAFIFGPTPFSCESATAAVVTASNVGGAPSTPLQVVLEGAFPDRFRVDKDGCGGKSLAVAATCVVQVLFVPKQHMEQPTTADLVIKGAGGERAATALSGQSSASNFDVFPLMAGFLDFQTIKLGMTSPVLEDLWTNNTDFPAIPGAPVLTGINAADFTIASDTCTGKSIPPRQSCRIGVQMKPTAAGQRFATVNVTATGACGYDFGDVLTLVGVGE
jgi:hypothetical protein